MAASRFDPKCYICIGAIGSGSFGNVSKCQRTSTDINLPEYVALKSIALRHTDNDVSQREYIILKECNHPNILKLFHCEIVEVNNFKHIYLYTELCDDNLKTFLNLEKLSKTLFYQMCWQMIQGCVYLHSKRIVHRDIKPENILVNHKGRKPEYVVVKIADLGLARLIPVDPSSGIQFSTVGTKKYSSPEIVRAIQRGEKATILNNPRATDIFSLAAVIYEMFTKKLPFTFDDLGKDSLDVHTVVRTNVTDRLLATVLIPMLQWDPMKRPNSAAISKFFNLFIITQDDQYEFSTEGVDMLELVMMMMQTLVEELQRLKVELLAQREELTKKERETKNILGQMITKMKTAENEAFKKAVAEKDKQLRLAEERNRELEEVVARLKQHQGTSADEMEKNNERLKRRMVLEAYELQEDEEKELKETSTATGSSILSMQDTQQHETSSECISPSASVIMPSAGRGYINISSINRGDNVMIVWSDEHVSFVVYNEGPALSFLHSDCLDQLGLSVADGSPNKRYLTAEVVDKEYCQASRAGNRFRVAKGTKFYRVKCRPMSSSSSSSVRPPSDAAK